MTTPASAHRRSLLAKIHIARTELGLDEVTYRACLSTVTGKDSCKKMRIAELEALVDYFQEKGWHSKRVPSRPLASAAQRRMVWSLWLQLRELGVLRSSSAVSLGKYVRRMTGTSSLEWLTPEQASQLIEALKCWIARVKEGESKRGSGYLA